MLKKSQINAKSVSRIAAIQVLYQFANDQYRDNNSIEDLLIKIIDFYKNSAAQEDFTEVKNTNMIIYPNINYLKKLTTFTLDNLDHIDSIVSEYLINNWTLKNIPRVLHALLRVAICEIQYFKDVPRKVVLNEYINIAANMLNEREIGFINSTLDRISNIECHS